MRRPLALSVRRIVLLALAPAPVLGCNAATAGGSSLDAAALPDAGEDVGLTSEHPDADQDGALDAYVSTDADGADANCVNRCGFPVCGQPACDPRPYDDGGTGACAPRWLQGDGCNGGQVLFPCGLPATALPNPSGSSYGFCATYCMGSQNFNGCAGWDDGGSVSGPLGGGGLAYYADAGDAAAVVACYFDCTGRRPATLIAEAPRQARIAGEVLAVAAYLEAASVAAFLDLAAQVEAHGAPRELVRALRRAARDEVRHARDVGVLARARGGEPAAVRLADTGPRSLLTLALENANDGCVRETWGAACAVAQALRATDLEVRRAMRAIARDELRHATLSWDLADWLASRLTPAERAQVEERQAQALAELESELAGEPAEAWRAQLGLPTRDEAQAILEGMRADVWAQAA